jgi:hypothetical protein
MEENSGDIYYIFVAIVKRKVGYLKARRLVRELTGKSYYLTGFISDDTFRFKINKRCWFDLNSLKLKIVDDELSLIIGKAKSDSGRLASMNVMAMPTANRDSSIVAEDPASELEQNQEVKN